METTETLEQKATRLESERDGVSEMLKEAIREKEKKVAHLQNLLVAARDERDALRESVNVKRIVDRFLQWKLPENFNPDGGISFKRMRNENTPYPAKNEPVGTNLLDAQQAEEMIRFLLRQG